MDTFLHWIILASAIELPPLELVGHVRVHKRCGSGSVGRQYSGG